MNFTRFAVAAIGLILSTTTLAQTPAAAPAGSTGLCKDGSYSTASTKRGACAGHKGVKEWYAADAKTTTPAAPPATAAAAPAPAAPAPAAAPAAPAPATRTAAAKAGTTPVAAGGGNGQVWVNTTSKVYHCEGDRYYGKTKAGSYMTEAAAKAAGNRPDHGKACA